MELKPEKNKQFGNFSISRKEKSLLLLLAAAAALWLSNKFFLAPQGEMITGLKAEKAGYETEKMSIQEILSGESRIQKEWEDIRAEHERIAEKYYSNANQPELMHMLNGIIDSSKLEIASISFREPETVRIEEAEAEFSGIALAYRGSFSELEEFIALVKSSPKKFIIEQLSLNKEDGDRLNGELTLSAIAYEKADSIEDGYFNGSHYKNMNKADPFKAFDGYVEVPVEDGEGGDEDKRALLCDLEADNIYFMGTGSGVTGKVERFGTARYGKTSIRTEYFISTGYQPERAFVVLDDQDISIKYPPSSIGIWVYSYGYSPVTVGLRFRDEDGEKVDIELEKGVSWLGWKFISAVPPQDVNLYPLKLDRVYLELGPDKDDYGVLLFDRIEAGYPENEESSADNGSYIFYVVKPGDTFESISESFYGSRSRAAKVAADNGLSRTALPEAGKVLVIRK